MNSCLHLRKPRSLFSRKYGLERLCSALSHVCWYPRICCNITNTPHNTTHALPLSAFLLFFFFLLVHSHALTTSHCSALSVLHPSYSPDLCSSFWSPFVPVSISSPSTAWPGYLFPPICCVHFFFVYLCIYIPPALPYNGSTHPFEKKVLCRVCPHRSPFHGSRRAISRLACVFRGDV